MIFNLLFPFKFQKSLLESKLVISLLWLMIKIMRWDAHQFGIKKTITTIGIWFVIMDIQMYWSDQCMKKVQRLQNAKNGIQCMKVFVQQIKWLFQFLNQ